MANSSFIDETLRSVADDLINGFSDEIRSSGRSYTGASANPNNWRTEIVDGKLILTNDLEYMGTVDQGRGPTVNEGDGSLRAAIYNWLYEKNIQIRRYSKGARGGRFVNKNPSNVMSAAYAISRAIHIRGYSVASSFREKTFATLWDSIVERLGQASAVELKERVDQELDKLRGLS